MISDIFGWWCKQKLQNPFPSIRFRPTNYFARTLARGSWLSPFLTSVCVFVGSPVCPQLLSNLIVSQDFRRLENLSPVQIPVPVVSISQLTTILFPGYGHRCDFISQKLRGSRSQHTSIEQTLLDLQSYFKICFIGLWLTTMNLCDGAYGWHE